MDRLRWFGTCFQDEIDRSVDELAVGSGEGKRNQGGLLAFWLKQLGGSL